MPINDAVLGPVAELLQEGVILLDETHHYLYLNAAARVLLGVGEEELRGHSFLQHVAVREQSALAASLCAATTQPHRWSTVRPEDGGPERVLEFAAQAQTSAGRPLIAVTVQDVTARVQAARLVDQQVAERTHELTTLLDVTAQVAATLELRPLLGVIVDQLASVIAHSDASLYVVEGDALRLLEYRFAGAQPPLSVQTRVPLAASYLWQVALQQGEAVVIDDLLGATPLAARYRAHLGDRLAEALPYCRSYLAVPLVLKGQVSGALVITNAAPDYFTPRRQALVRAFADHAAIAMENSRLYAQAQTLAALEERQRLARELHDSVSQALYGIALGARTARTLLEHDAAGVAEPLDYVLSLAEAGLAEMRALIFALVPEALATEGVVVALEKQLAVLRARHGLAISAAFAAEPAVPLPVKEAVYRIAQEALHNTVKHAQARAVAVHLESGPDGLVLEIRDDGRGFEAGGTFPGHLGLRTMRERARDVGGTLAVQSEPGQGTRIRACIPWPAEAPEGETGTPTGWSAPA